MRPDAAPFVTVVLPCRNEEKYIGVCLESIILSDFPKERLEVLVVDGMSEDGTREILDGYAADHGFIRVLDNIKRTTPCAFNLGIKHARGDVLIIMGTHASYARDYISKCVKYLIEYGADNVGGVIVTVPRNETLIGKAIAQALSHKFGVGNSVFRTGSKTPVFVDTVFGGCYKKEVFKRIGMFNEMLHKHQDMELNCRLKKAGGRILLAPDIICWYYARTGIRSFLRHNWGNGLSVFISLRESRVTPVSWRHLAPLSFVAALSASAVLSAFIPAFIWPLLAIAGSYSLAALYYSGKICRERNDLRFLAVMPPAFAGLHVSHGLGSLYGVLLLLTSKRFWTCRIFSEELDTS